MASDTDHFEAWTAQSGEPLVNPEHVPGNVVTVDELPDLEALRQDPYVDVDQHLAHVVVAADEDERVAIRTGRAADGQEEKVSGAEGDAPADEAPAGQTPAEASGEASQASSDAPANNPSTDEAPASE